MSVIRRQPRDVTALSRSASAKCEVKPYRITPRQTLAKRALRASLARRSLSINALTRRRSIMMAFELRQCMEFP